MAIQTNCQVVYVDKIPEGEENGASPFWRIVSRYRVVKRILQPALKVICLLGATKRNKHLGELGTLYCLSSRSDVSRAVVNGVR